MKKIILLVITVLLASAVIGGSVYAGKGGTKGPPPGKGKNGGTNSADISIFNFGYDPSLFNTKDDNDGKVIWILDKGRHTVTFFGLEDDPKFDSGRLTEGDTFTLNSQALSTLGDGSHGYYCKIHGAVKMSGSICIGASCPP